MTIILSINKNYCIQTSQYIYTMIHVEQLQEINDMKLAKKKKKSVILQNPHVIISKHQPAQFH